LCRERCNEREWKRDKGVEEKGKERKEGRREEEVGGGFIEEAGRAVREEGDGGKEQSQVE
jgi:hypothetical protein